MDDMEVLFHKIKVLSSWSLAHFLKTNLATLLNNGMLHLIYENTHGSVCPFVIEISHEFHR